MRKMILFLAVYLLACTLYAQPGHYAGMNFQALASDVSGKILSDQAVQVRVSFASREGAGRIFYTEVHETSTDALGLFNLELGHGKASVGSFSDIPWASGQVWMDVELLSGRGRFSMMQSTQLRAVPYAFHAETSNRLADEGKAIALEREKNQSIRWNTSGNEKTLPETHFIGTRDNKDLVIKTDNITRAIVTKEGQVKVFGGVSGSDTELGAYPMIVRGSTQGIHVKVNGSRTKANNFVTFGDDKQFSWGRIEGQTFPELEQTWQYQLKVASFALQGAGLANAIAAFTTMAAGAYAAGGCSIGTLIFAFCSPGYFIEGSAFIASVAVLAIQAAALGLEADKWATNIRLEIGVAYNSGAGDYAEWLERSPEERDLQFGEIVGVKGGKVSLNTRDADHIMVISTRPIVVGNAPQPQNEHLYEQVAFLGQAPVRVAGKVDKGDYILASGNNDGMGIAVKPTDMQIADYPRIVGVAWESAPDLPVNVVKIGIGINANDLAPKVEEISHKVDNIIAYLEGREPLRGAAAQYANLPLSPSQVQAGPPRHKLFSDEAFDQMLDADQEGIIHFYAELEKELHKFGAKISDNPELEALFKDPVNVLKKFRRDPTLTNNWAQFDLWMVNNRK